MRCSICGYAKSLYGCNRNCERPLTILPHPPTWPGYIDNRKNGQCDCGGCHSSADCPNAIIGWDGWQA